MSELATAKAFFQPGVSEIVFIDTIASATLDATAAEINAGLKLMNELFDVAGWSKSTNWIERRRAKTRVRTQLAGATTFEGSSITFTADQAGIDAAAEFEEGQTGFAYFADRGLVQGLPAEVFQVEVGAVVPLRNYDNDYMKIRVDFGINRYERVVIPSLAVV